MLGRPESGDSHDLLDWRRSFVARHAAGKSIEQTEETMGGERTREKTENGNTEGILPKRRIDLVTISVAINAQEPKTTSKVEGGRATKFGANRTATYGEHQGKTAARGSGREGRRHKQTLLTGHLCR